VTVARAVLILFLPALAASGCASTRNYGGDGPRFAGTFRVPDVDPAFRVASFNIKYSREIDKAIALFHKHAELGQADVIALQEMREDGVERIARALGFDYVYYPSSQHPKSGNFGNAVLSRWPIVEDRRIVLPHLSRWRKQQRSACLAVVDVNGVRIRVYSVHLETPFGVSGGQRRDQARTILADAAGSQEPVIVAGDFNSRWIGAEFEDAGYRWVTKDAGGTIRWFAWDHVFTRGLPTPEKPRGAIVRDTEGASDHRPVWAELSFSAPTARP
jgi:endonuclease/exonuclease/phosphatase family metal-dependent hydrolase